MEVSEMGVAMTLKEYLDTNEFEYEVIDHFPFPNSRNFTEDEKKLNNKIAKPLLLGHEDSYLLAVIPASHRLDIDRLNQAMARGLTVMNSNELDETFRDCERDSIPPCGDLYGVDTIVDPALFDEEDVYFEAGDHEIMIHMTGLDFRRLLQDAQKHKVSHHL